MEKIETPITEEFDSTLVNTQLALLNVEQSAQRISDIVHSPTITTPNVRVATSDRRQTTFKESKEFSIYTAISCIFAMLLGSCSIFYIHYVAVNAELMEMKLTITELDAKLNLLSKIAPLSHNSVPLP